MSIALPLHILAAVIWVGGMFFAHYSLRPNLSLLDPPIRLTLVRDTLARFFKFVWISIIVLWFTGIWIITSYIGWNAIPWHVLVMMILAIVMTAVYCLIYFDHFKKIDNFVNDGDIKAAGERLGKLSKLVHANLMLGLITVAIASTRGSLFAS